MSNPKTFDTASFQLTDSQRAAIEELYPIINEEFKADAFIQVAFQKALLQQNKKISFVTAINPVVMEMAKGLGSPLTIPLAAILSRTMADEWLERSAEVKTARVEQEPTTGNAAVGEEAFYKQRLSQEDPHFQEVPKERIVGASKAFEAPYGTPAEIVKVEAPYAKPTDFAGILRLTTVFSNEEVENIVKELEAADRMPKTPEQEEKARRILVGMNNAGRSILGLSLGEVKILFSYEPTSVPQKDDPIIPTEPVTAAMIAADPALRRLPKGSKAPDRSRPVLSVAVLRGLEDLLVRELYQASTRGRPDARLSIKYLERLLAFGQKREADKKTK